MKLTVCDIDYKIDKKIVPSTWRVGTTHVFKLDVCDNHKYWVRENGSGLVAMEKYLQLGK